jgi:hypothetical protein
LEATVAAEANPVVKEALVEGRISADQAAAVLDGADAQPEAVERLVQTAEERGLRGVRDEARKLRLEREDPQVLHERQHRLMEFSHWVDDEGMVAGRFRLPPEIGAPIVTRLEREADRIYRAAPKEERHERPHAAFVADAFVATVNGEAKGGKSRTDLVLVADHDRFLGLADEGRSHIVGVGPVPIEVIREMAAGAFLKGVAIEGTEIVKVHHFGRKMPAVLETAILLGPNLDGLICVDCGGRHGIEIDHVDPVANGGPTTRVNLQPRCRQCHRRKTERDRVAGLLRGRASIPSAPANYALTPTTTQEAQPWSSAAREPSTSPSGSPPWGSSPSSSGGTAPPRRTTSRGRSPT